MELKVADGGSHKTEIFFAFHLNFLKSHLRTIISLQLRLKMTFFLFACHFSWINKSFGREKAIHSWSFVAVVICLTHAFRKIKLRVLRTIYPY